MNPFWNQKSNYFSKVKNNSVCWIVITNEVLSRLFEYLNKTLQHMPGKMDLGFDNMLWKMNLECGRWIWNVTGKKMLHWNLFKNIVQMCVIHGQTCIWGSILMSFAHLKLDPKSYILIQMYLQYVLFVLNFIGFFVFLLWSFFQLPHKALIAFLAYKSVTPYSLHYWNNGRRGHTVYIKHLWSKD